MERLLLLRKQVTGASREGEGERADMNMSEHVSQETYKVALLCGAPQGFAAMPEIDAAEFSAAFYFKMHL